ncbi:porin family protein [Mastigocladopsis repens]|uniref:hypothetical protein n=1 Tax=Mastigocladopsis repens TaxID=221287 RepID=UPI0002F55669|nr:hypothetical protein [Mastigocladopsis repens]
MQPKGWIKINLFFWIVLASSSTNLCCIKKVDAAQAANTDLSIREHEIVSKIPFLGVAWVSAQLCQEERGQKADQEEVQTKISGKTEGKLQQQEAVSHTTGDSKACFATADSKTPSLYSQTQPNQVPPIPELNQVSPTPELNQTPAPPPQPTPASPTAPLAQPSIQNNPPQLEGQPADFPKPLSPPVEERLQVPEIENPQRLERLLQRLQQKKQPPTKPNFGELGRLLVRERQLEQLEQVPPPARPVSPPQPIGYLQAHVGYFHTNNIFSSKVDPVEDGLVYSGLTLASAPLPLGRRTYLNGSIDGNLIRYLNQSKYNYNQLRFNVGVYQQLSRRMYGEIGWSNQQLFYARNGSNFNAGDRFLNENSFRLSLGRRDPLTPRLMLDSFYELRWSLTDPPSKQDNRDRVINAVWISLNYYLKQSLQVGLDYQFNLSNFTQRQREDQYHRLYAHLTYGVSNSTNLSLQGGATFGGSTDSNIDFDGWFFTVNYILELGRF